MKPQQIVLLYLWAALTASPFIYQNFIGDGLKFPFALNPPMDLKTACFIAVPITVASALRWTVLTKRWAYSTVLSLLIVGLAITEFAYFLVLFISEAPSSDVQMLTTTLVFAGMLQFCPLFLKWD